MFTGAMNHCLLNNKGHMMVVDECLPVEKTRRHTPYAKETSQSGANGVICVIVIAAMRQLNIVIVTHGRQPLRAVIASDDVGENITLLLL